MPSSPQTHRATSPTPHLRLLPSQRSPGGVAQSGRAPPSHGGSQGFKSPHLHPHNRQVRASSASSGRRSLHVAAALRPRAQVPVQPGRLSATTRLGPGPPMMTTEGSRRFQPELRVARQAGLEGHCGSGRWSSRSRDTAGRPGPGPPGRAVARRTRRAPRVTGADTADAERPDTDTGRRTSTPGHWTRTRGHRVRGHWTVTPDTGHRTRGHDRLRGQGA
jgi:hypothetical protein